MSLERVSIRGANIREKSRGESRVSYGELERNTWNPSYRRVLNRLALVLEFLCCCEGNIKNIDRI